MTALARNNLAEMLVRILYLNNKKYLLKYKLWQTKLWRDKQNAPYIIS